MTGAIFVRNDYSVAQGQTVTASDPWTSADDPHGNFHAAFVMKLGAQPVHFVSAGAINVTDVDGVSNGATGLYGLVDLNGPPLPIGSTLTMGSVTIASTGSLIVLGGTSSGSQPGIYGYYSAAGWTTFENDGQVNVTSLGTGFAVGVAFNLPSGLPGSMPAGGYAINTGTITATAQFGAGAWLGNEGAYGTQHPEFDNSGSIVAHGGAYGILVGNIGQQGSLQVHINNSGSITATGSGSPSVGIMSQFASVGDLYVDNSGTITADKVVEFVSTPGNNLQLHLTNRAGGVLNGDVLVQAQFGGLPESSGTSVVNAGTINGNVDLTRNGVVSFDGRGGIVHGTLSFAGGSSIVYLGSEGETVAFSGIGSNTLTDGTGADHIQGGAGADLINVVGGGDVIDGGGGVNTISFQTAAGAVTVSLANTGAQATGGAGSETISHFQNLTGSAFADHLTGDIFDNVIDGGGGNDVIDAGGGTNTIAYDSAAVGVTVNLALQGSAQNTGVGSQTFSNFQNIRGSAFADHLYGDAHDNVIESGGGDDVVDGGAGTNTLSFKGLSHGVTVDLTKQGQAQNTGVGSMTLSNIQNVTGSAGDDTFVSDSANNAFDGLTGFNTLSYAAASNAVTIDVIDGTASGAGSGSDTFTNIDQVIGSAFNDTIIADGTGHYDGGGGINTLDLSSPSSSMGGVTVNFAAGTVVRTSSGTPLTGYVANIQNLIGTVHDDIFVFGSTNHTVTGGLGADKFVFTPGSGIDVVTDFTHADSDKIDLSAFSKFHSLQDVHNASHQQGADTVINLGSGSLTLSNVQLANLSASDFVFSTSTVHLTLDFNNDHTADVIFRNPSTGDWGYAAMKPTGYDWHYFGNSTASYAVGGEGDFNGDRLPDVVFRDATTGDWGYSAGNTSGGFDWDHIGNSGANYSIGGVGDFDGDKITDVIFRDSSTGDWGYEAMVPYAPPVWHHLGNSGVNFEVAGTGDFDGDGITDALFRDPSTGEWGYDAMQKGANPIWHYLGNSGLTYTVAGTGDFDGDGITDVLFRDPATGDWGYEAMQRGAAPVWHHLGNSTVAYTVGTTGDFDGDGKTDVAFIDTLTGDWGYTSRMSSGGDWHHMGVTSPDFTMA